MARRQDAPPRFVEVTYALSVITDEPERRVGLVHKNLTSYGTVYNSLAAACDVHGVMTAVVHSRPVSRGAEPGPR